MKSKSRRSPLLRSLLTVGVIIAAIVIYAYGFQVTQVNLQETAKPQRQQQLVRIIRAIAQPDLLTYPTESTTTLAPILVPCPASLPAPAAPAGVCFSVGAGAGLKAGRPGDWVGEGR